MLLKTSNGKQFTVDWVDTVSADNLFLQMQDERRLPKIADDFDGLSWLERYDENQGDKRFDGFDTLRHIKRAAPGVVIISIERSDA